MIKIILFSYSNKYRDHGFNNLHQTGILGSFLILNLNRNRLLYKLFFLLSEVLKNLIMVISCDADPLIKEKSIGYNIWFNEPDEVDRLSHEGSHLENNLFFFRYPFESKKIQKFTLYPCRFERHIPDKRPTKIIYISEIDTNFSQESLALWKISKNKLLEDLSFLESGGLNLGAQTSGVKSRIYIDLKRLIRMELVVKLKEVYGDKFILVGKDWKKIGLESIDINYDRSYRRSLYRGNIAVDFGAQCGAAIFYQRSSEIIESGGLLVQSHQLDETRNESLISDKNKFRNFTHLKIILDELLHNKNEYLFRLKQQERVFTDRLIHNELLNIWTQKLAAND